MEGVQRFQVGREREEVIGRKGKRGIEQLGGICLTLLRVRYIVLIKRIF
jgi:hypothetical protein